MPTISTLVVAVRADIKQFQAGMAQAETQTVGATNSMGAGISKFAGVTTIGAGIAAIALVKFGESAIKVAADHQKTLAQLQLQVGGTTAGYEKQAQALENLTGFQHDEVLAADTVLARLHLTQDQIQGLVPAILDFAAATGTDAAGASATFEKALLGTARGLKIGGIAFKDTGTLAGNYAELIKLTSTASIKGSASLDTYAKGLRSLSSQWKDLEEKAGAALISVLQPMLPVLKDLIGVLEKLGPDILLIGAGLLAWKALSFIPRLLLGIASGLEAIGAAGAANAFLGLASAASVAVPAVAAVGGALLTAKVIADQSAGTTQEFAKHLDETAVSAQGLTNVAEGTAFASARLGTGMQDAAKQALALRTGIAKATDATKASGDATNASGDAAAIAAQKQQQLADAHDAVVAAAQKQRTAEQALAGGLLGLAADSKSVSDAQDVVNKLKRQGKTDTDKYREAVLAELNATLQVKNDLRDYANTLKDAGANNEDVKNKLITLGRQFGLTKADVLDALGATKQFTQGLKTMAAAAHGSGAAVMDGFVQGMLAREPAVRAAVQHLGQIAIDKLNSTLGTKSPSTITEKMGEDVVQGLINGLKAREKDVQKVFDSLSSKLQNLTSRASDFRSAISGGFGSLLDLSNIPEGGDIASFVAESAASAKQWGSVLEALQRQGLSGPLLSQIAGMGPQALGMAQQLLQLGPQQIAAINQQYQAILKVQDHVSKSLTEKYFGDKIDQLREVLGDVRETLHHIAKRLDDLSGHASGGIATRPTLGIFGEHGPEALVPLGAGAGMGGITGPIVIQLDGKQLAVITRDELLKLGARNGTTGL